MDKASRNAIERATQQARKLLDDDFSSQLEGTLDVLRSGVIAAKGGAHLSARQLFQRDKIVAAIEHKRAAGMTAVEAVTDYVRDAAFTTLNRFIALKTLEARELVQECITKGEGSAGYREFCGMAPGLALIPDAAGYRLYLESLFDEFSTEIKVLFDRRDAASVVWPKRQAFEGLLTILNAPELAGVWGEDETIGWVYQFFNSGEERKKMRDESQAPRNSRELAVRNQFFTPRYVVQFLVDNTLGRLWLEMHGGQTSLAKLCEYLVRSVEVPPQPRPRKDPRDLRILDPACGSGHFLLYSFDLLLTIYEEAWAAEGPSPRCEATGRSLREDYPDITELRRMAPKLIVESNLHGVDIDPRCAQVAALALWLRAQRAWKDLRVAASDRPRIQRTHIVVAEPMPGDAALVEEFAARLDPPLLRDLFKKMVGETRLAGELGALLRVENGIAAQLRHAREQFVKQRQTTGFLPGMEPAMKQGSLDLSGIDDDYFFHEAETLIIEALRLFAESATSRTNVRRRLFAGDAAQGIAFIDLMRRRFDVVLMNPPFGDPTPETKGYLSKNFKGQPNDLYACFLERVITELCTGLSGQITPREFLTYASFSSLRKDVIAEHASLVLLADFGLGVMDAAMVRAAAYILDCRSLTKNANKAVAVRLVDVQEKSKRLLEAVRSLNLKLNDPRVFLFIPSEFSEVGEGALAYWIGSETIERFRRGPFFGDVAGDARLGVQTSNNEQFLRLLWEVGDCGVGHRWRPYLKGGDFSKYASLIHLAIDWQKDGSHIQRSYGSSVRLRESWQYEKGGLNYPLINESGINVSILPIGTVYDNGSPSVYPKSSVNPYLLLGLINSRFVEFCFRCLTSTRHWQVGYLRRLPWCEPDDLVSEKIVSATEHAVELQRTLFARIETSPEYSGPSCLRGGLSDNNVEEWLRNDASHYLELQVQLIEVDWKLDQLAFEAFGVTEVERRVVEETVGIHPCELTTRQQICEGDDGSSSDETQRAHRVSRFPIEDLARREGCTPRALLNRVSGYPIENDIEKSARDLVSFLFGICIGKWSLQDVKNCQAELCDAFAAIESRSSGTGAIGRILVDDEGHASDVIAAMFNTLSQLGAADPARVVEDIVRLGNFQGGLRSWVSRELFKWHLSAYSASQRKAPIYWQIAVPSGRYSLWLYSHSLTRDTLYTVQNTYLSPKIAHEERRLAGLKESAGTTPTSQERKQIASAETLVEELREFLEEVRRVAPLWRPVLDDGMILTMAPLWRLVPHLKPWQKELKSKWDDFAAGKYDWAQAAIHLWPERVVPKCATDRSLAIAHGLEDVFWAEGHDGKSKPRPTPKRPIDEIVRERTSAAVKAALKELVDASAPTSPKGRTRRSPS